TALVLLLDAGHSRFHPVQHGGDAARSSRRFGAGGLFRHEVFTVQLVPVMTHRDEINVHACRRLLSGRGSAPLGRQSSMQLRASSFELPAMSVEAGSSQLGAVFAHTVLSLNAADWRAHVGGRWIAA